MLVYTHANGSDIAETLDSVIRHHMEEGYLAIRAQSGVPGVASSYGVPKGRQTLRASRTRPAIGDPSGRPKRYLNFAPKPL